MTPLDELRHQEVQTPDGQERRWYYNQAYRMRLAPTKAEWAMAEILTEGEISYTPQAVLGPYIVDFLLPVGLVIEVDGSSHRGKSEQDEERTARMIAAGYTVVRFSNGEVLRAPGAVLNKIERIIWRLRAG